MQTIYLGRSRQRCFRPVGAVELVQIAINALLGLLHVALHLRASEVSVSGIDRLELAAVDGNTCLGEQFKLETQRHKLGAGLADRSAIIRAKVGNRLVIRDQTTRQPHDLDVTTGLALHATARFNPVEIAVYMELQQNRRVIAQPAGP